MKENIEYYRPKIEEDIINEVNKDDPRYDKNKKVYLKDSNLGQIAEILDAVKNPFLQDRATIDSVYAEFLDCGQKELIRDRKIYAGYKSNLMRYALNKIFKSSKYSKEELEISFKKDGIEEPYIVSLGSNEKDLDLIQIGVDKEVRVPSSYHIGIKNRNKKFIVKTEVTMYEFIITLIYKKGDSKIIDNFLLYLNNWIKENNFYKNKKISPQGEFLKIEDYDWEDVILKDDIKEQITMNIIDFFRKEEIYKKNGIQSKMGLIWEGPPGTGKTLTAKILANKINDVTFIWVTPDSVSYPKDVKIIYSMARELSPSIVFFEDADLSFKDRSIDGRNSALGEVMNQLDGLIELKGVVTIFTSNDPGSLEKALIDRPGRFDERIYFGPPDEESSLKIMIKYLKIPKHKLEDLKEITKKSVELKLTGSHLKRLCDLSTIYAINRNSINNGDIAIVEIEDLLKALDSMKNLRIKAGSDESMIKKQNIKTSNLSIMPESSFKKTIPILHTKEKKKTSMISMIVEEKIKNK